MRHVTRGAVTTRRAPRGVKRAPGLVVVAAAIVGLLAFGAGLAWLAMDRRRIRDAERERPVR
ncbi:hypothetical protein BMG05_01305 [Mycobacterium malmoense]|nr:hypothetical protein BMG05_01305 [Mycobacterium malmoense]